MGLGFRVLGFRDLAFRGSGFRHTTAIPRNSGGLEILPARFWRGSLGCQSSETPGRYKIARKDSCKFLNVILDGVHAGLPCTISFDVSCRFNMCSELETISCDDANSNHMPVSVES